jgi:hypothetical protein
VEVRRPHIEQNPIHTPLDANTCNASYTVLKISDTRFIVKCWNDAGRIQCKFWVSSRYHPRVHIVQAHGARILSYTLKKSTVHQVNICNWPATASCGITGQHYPLQGQVSSDHSKLITFWVHPWRSSFAQVEPH